MCLWRRQLVHEAPVPAAVARLKVRGVHVGFVESSIDSLGLLRQRNASDPAAPAYSDCVPLVWWPLWGYNIGEFFQSSVLAIAELLAAGIVDDQVMLAPEVGGWPLRDFHLQMLQAFTRHAVRTTGQLAPKCGARHELQRGCSPQRCYERVLLCRFRDVYDHEAPVAPWDAARRIVTSLRLSHRRPVLPPRAAATAAASVASGAASRAPPAYAVLFVSRANAKNGARRISNEAELLQRCGRWAPPAGCLSAATPSAGLAACTLRVFGRHGFRADVAAVQEADVLVGTHGAALIHAIFMRRGAALLEVRPYGFNGRWPDQYHYAMARQQNATHAFVLRTTDRFLCESAHTNGVPPANVSAWDARPLNTYVRVAAFERALAAAACTSGRAGGQALPHAWSEIPPADGSWAPFDYGALHSVRIDNG